MRDLHDLVRLATRQQGHFTTRQANAIGLSNHTLVRLRRRGLTEQAHRGVYRLAGSPSGFEQRLAAVCLAGHPVAVASHRSALRMWRLRTVDEVLEATVRRPRVLRVPGATVHRSVDLQPDDIAWIDGIPVTTPARTLCDAGSVFPRHEVRRLLDHAVATGLVDVAELWRFRRRVGKQGRNGVGVLAELLDGLPPRVTQMESGPEIALLRLVSEHGLPPPSVQVPVRVGTRSYRPDLAYPAAAVAIEYDGRAVHSEVDRFVADRRRQNDLVLAGWTVLRFTWSDVRDRPSAVAHEIHSALAASGCV